MDNRFTDKELDKLLATAKPPKLPDGFADRLQAKLQAHSTSNVIAFPQKKQVATPSRRGWLSAIPLAASLAAGIYIGAIGALPESLQGTLLADATGTDLGTGIEDVESFLNGESS